MHTVIRQRMTIMKKAVQMHGQEGYSVVLEAYDAMWGRITSGESIGIFEDALAPDEEQLVDMFIAEQLVLGSDNQKIQATPLHEAFVEWCLARDIRREDVLGKKRFGKAMSQRVSRLKSNYVYYIGVAFKEQEKAA